MKMGILPLSTLSNDPLTNATKAMDLAQDLFDIPKIIDPNDLITMPDDLSIMTYLSYFRNYVANSEKKGDDEERELEKNTDKEIVTNL